MSRSKRVSAPSNLLFLITIFVLAGTIFLSYTGLKFSLITVKSFFSPVPFMILILVVMIVAYRGLFLRVRYALYLALVSVLLLIIEIISLSLFSYILYFPLIVLTIMTAIFLILFHRYYNFPTRFFDKPEISISIVAIIIVMLYGVLGSLILGGQFHPRIDNPVTAIYYTGEVVTTLGFGDIVPYTHISRLFTVSLAILGLGTFFGSTTVIIAPLIYNRGRRVVSFLERIESERLEDYIIIIGYSPILKPLVKYMIAKDELVIIAKDKPETDKELEEAGIFIEFENDMDIIIKRFNLKRARKIILGYDDDGKNILNAISIRNKYGNELDKKLIAIVNEPRNYDKVKSIISETLDPSVLLVEYFKKYF
ncbi:MAG: ion channel [Thermoplasmata archaeon]